MMMNHHKYDRSHIRWSKLHNQRLILLVQHNWNLHCSLSLVLRS